MTHPDALLAKGPRTVRRPDGTAEPKLVTVAEHTRDVIDAFSALFGTPDGPTGLAESWRRFFRLEVVTPFLVCGRRAALLHDLGKVNDGFQRTVRKTEPGQAVWHEHLSALILHGSPGLWAWLADTPECNVDVVLAAVAGHHLRAGRHSRDRTKLGLQLNGNGSVRVPAEGVREVLRVDPSAVPPGAADGSLAIPETWWFHKGVEPNPAGRGKAVIREFGRWGRRLNDDDAPDDPGVGAAADRTSPEGDADADAGAETDADEEA